eukprot:gene4516-7894_t
MEKYDQNTYVGRVRHFLEVTSPSNLFITKKKLEIYQQTLKDFEGGKDVPKSEYFKAKTGVSSMVHPDTGKVIPMALRMSFFVPGNVLVVLGMLKAQSLGSIVLWQSINQTYNVGVNYANSNQSNPLTTKQLGVSYLGALVSSVGTAVGAKELVSRASFLSAATKGTLMNFVPFTAVCAANIFNISLMRINELTKGISVFDEDENEIGVSQKAGQVAVYKTIISRLVLVIPILFIPPILMNLGMRIKFMKSNPKFHLPMELSIITLCLGLGLPACIGLFPQTVKLEVEKLEKEFQNVERKNGKKLNYVYFNKGL